MRNSKTICHLEIIQCFQNIVVKVIVQRSSACSNRKFTGKVICNEMTLCKSPPVSNKKVTKSLAKTLDAQEREWMEKQKLISEEKLTRDCKDALKATEYVHTLLEMCNMGLTIHR